MIDDRTCPQEFSLAALPLRHSGGILALRSSTKDGTPHFHNQPWKWIVFSHWTSARWITHSETNSTFAQYPLLTMGTVFPYYHRGMRVALCMVATVLCAPLLVPAASLDKDPINKTYCPYRCQNADIRVDTHGHVVPSCDPLTEDLQKAEHGAFSADSQFAKTYLTCKKRPCGTITYADFSGKVFTKNRCLDKVENDWTGDPTVVVPKSLERNIPPGTVFDEHGNPLNWQPSLSDLPPDTPTSPKALIPFDSFHTFQFDEASKHLNDPYYQGSVS